jgi:hypothetical protein
MANLSEMIQLATAMQERAATKNRQPTGLEAMGKNLAVGSSQLLPGYKQGLELGQQEKKLALDRIKTFMDYADFQNRQLAFKQYQDRLKGMGVLPYDDNDKYIMNTVNWDSIPTAGTVDEKGNPVIKQPKTQMGNINEMIASMPDNVSMDMTPTGGAIHVESKSESERKRRTGQAERDQHEETLAKRAEAQFLNHAKMDDFEAWDALQDKSSVFYEQNKKDRYSSSFVPSKTAYDKWWDISVAEARGEIDTAKKLITDMQARQDAEQKRQAEIEKNKPVPEQPKSRKLSIKERLSGVTEGEPGSKEVLPKSSTSKLPPDIKTTSQALKYYMGLGLNREEAIRKIREEYK